MGKKPDDPIFIACVDLIGHTGAKSFEIRFTGPPDDNPPMVIVAVATYERAGEDLPQVAAGLTPRAAVYKLCEQLIDGGQCAHCSRPSGISDDFTGEMPASFAVCWYIFDPERSRFRRSCEGTDTRPCAVPLTASPTGQRCSHPEITHQPNVIDHAYIPDKRVRPED